MNVSEEESLRLLARFDGKKPPHLRAKILIVAALPGAPIS
jgi:hypothetical protein